MTIYLLLMVEMCNSWDWMPCICRLGAYSSQLSVHRCMGTASLFASPNWTILSSVDNVNLGISFWKFGNQIQMLNTCSIIISVPPICSFTLLYMPFHIQITSMYAVYCRPALYDLNVRWPGLGG